MATFATFRFAHWVSTLVWRVRSWDEALTLRVLLSIHRGLEDWMGRLAGNAPLDRHARPVADRHDRTEWLS